MTPGAVADNLETASGSLLSEETPLMTGDQPIDREKVLRGSPVVAARVPQQMASIRSLHRPCYLPGHGFDDSHIQESTKVPSGNSGGGPIET